MSKQLIRRTALTAAALIIAGFTALMARPDIKYTVSMEKPASHVFSVSMRYDDVNESFTDIKMAVWTPGYYWLVNYPQNVSSFSVRDDKGTTLSWQKTSKNIWHINTDGVKSIIVTYDVFANNHSVAEPFLDESHAFIAPAGLFIYPDGKLNEPSEITLNFPNRWSTVSTGLKAVKGKTNTFASDNFDRLFDSPILAGNQEVITFDVDGVPHHIASLIPVKEDKNKIIKAYSAIVKTAVALIGEMPYDDYSFLIMGPGGGGLEHLNSMAVFTGFRGGSICPDNREQFMGWMSFIAHEYFHLYNIKTIRPVALGPFDYDKENYTNMLWVSEGFTVYYENIILNRAGFMSRDEMLNSLKNTILTYESVPGRKVQPVTLSGFDTWIHPFMQGPEAINTTLSYYDKGCGLGLLLDLKIRHETDNNKSLDDVMRFLYFKYYKDLQRGFTDDEFRKVCEKISGCDLYEIFDYASTTQDIDYSKYFSYAGLTIDDKYSEMPGSYTGLRLRDTEGGAEVTVTETGSPAWEAGIASSDIIITIDGKKVNSAMADSIMTATNPGSTVEFVLLHEGRQKKVTLVTARKLTRSFDIGYITNRDPLQEAILNDLFRAIDIK